MEVKEASEKEKTEGCGEHTGWDEPFASHLESLLLENLRLVFQSAIDEISESGHDEAVVEKSILRRGLYAGSKNPVPTIVSDTLHILTARKKVSAGGGGCGGGAAPAETFSGGLNQLAEYTLLEMTSVLREVRPFLSAGEAMWWLLICDLNILQACRLEEDSSGSTGASEMVLSQLRVESQGHLSDSVTFGEFLKHIKIKNPVGGGTGEDTSLASMLKNLDNFLAAGGENGKSRPSQSSGLGQNPGPSRKGQCSKREAARSFAKSYHYGKNCCPHGSTSGSLRSGKTANVVIETKVKSSCVTSVVTSVKTGPSKKNAPPGAGDSSKPADPKPSANNPATGSKSFSEYYVGIPYDKSLGKYLPRDEKDRLILKLVPRIQGLENELQGWTEWANQKVMQAARKLGRVQPELKTMRQLTEAAKKYMQENNSRRLSIMENSVNGVDSLAEKGESIISGLEEQNLWLKEELEFAKSMALESAASYEEALDREQKAQKEVQSWDGQNGLLYKELETERKKLAALQQDVAKAKNSHLKAEARLERERKETEKLLAEAASIRKEREQLEARAKAEADSIKHKARSATKKSMEDIGKLESRFSEAVSRSDSSRIAAMRLGAKSLVTVAGLRRFKDHLGSGGLRQERECVMCLSEEISVVFVPCSHQVLCEKCNELHEKRGMKDCPSCRALIQRRIKVRFANP